jgi:hypothetical protein
VDSDALVDDGYMVPPFHPNCRCALQDTGTVNETLVPQTSEQAKATTSGGGWRSKLLGLLTGGGTDEEGDDDDHLEDL